MPPPSLASGDSLPRAQGRAGTLPRGASHRLLWLLTIAGCGAVLAAPAVWNGFPLLQYDTGGYLARWFEATLVPSRPGAYGLLLAATGRVDFWPAVAAQTLATIWVLALLLRAHGLGGAARLAILIGALSAVSTLPWLTSILLTDIFAGLAVLAMYLLVFRNDCLRAWERAALMLLVGFAAATHSATLVLLAGLAFAALAFQHFAQTHAPRGGARRAATAAALGVVMTFAGNYAVTGRIAWTPGGVSLLFGRMLQDGIVDRYLDERCPDATLRLCMYRKELPRDADVWFWGDDLFDEMGRFAGLGDEMARIATGSLRRYPLLQVKTALVATARQLVLVGSGEGVVNHIWHSYAIIDRYVPGAGAAMRAARQQVTGIDFTAINRLHVPVALVAMLLLPGLVWLGWRDERFAQTGVLAAAVAVTLLANAAVCGILSNPHDRYGARVAWLAVLVIVMAALQAHARRKENP